jgi:hypothetical protein
MTIDELEPLDEPPGEEGDDSVLAPDGGSEVGEEELEDGKDHGDENDE